MFTEKIAETLETSLKGPSFRTSLSVKTQIRVPWPLKAKKGEMLQLKQGITAYPSSSCR
jgi:hypothetical protein